MAIADTITSMQTHTSNAYTMIGYGTDLTGINKNLENLSSTIFNAFLEALRTPDTLFTNLPKKSASGSNISLTGVANAPMRITLSPSELTQASTPTPSSPQEVHTISGDNTILVRGKNLFDGIMEEGAYDNSNGNKTTNSSMRRNVNIIPVEPSTTYRISNNGTGVAMNVMQYRKNKTFISASVPSATSSFTTTENTYYINIYRGSTNVDKLQIEVGSTATTYEPYISQEAEIDLKSKNLFDTNVEQGGISTSDGSNTTNSNRIRTDSIIYLEAGTYTINASGVNNVNKHTYSSSGTWESALGSWQTLPYTFTLTAKKGVKFVFRNSNDSNIKPSNMTNCMLNEGTIALNYIPYYDYGFYGKISTYEDKFIRTSGKNLFDLTNPQTQSSNTPKVQDDKIVASSPTAWSSIYFTFTGLSKNTTYYIKSKLAFTSGGGVFSQIFGGSALDQSKAIKTYMSSITASGDYSTSFSTGDNDTITISFCTSGNSGIWTLSNIMLSTEDIPYEPYGNGTWYIKKNIGKVVLDGTENFTSAGTSGTDYRYNKTLSSLNIPNATTNNGLCISNYFQNVTIDTSKKWGAFYINGNWLVFYDKNQEMTDATTFNTWLSNNNPVIYYVLATPTYTQITGTLETQLENVYQKLLSYSGTTTISQINADLPFNMSIQAIEDISNE